MFGFIMGLLCLWGLIRVWRGPRWLRGCHGFGRWSRWSRGDVERGPFGFWLRGLFERLDTTPGQEKVIRQAVRDVMDAADGLKTDLRGLGDEVATAFREPGFDADKIAESFGQQDEQLHEVRRAIIGALAQIHEALEPEQRIQLAKWLQRHHRWGGPYRSAACA